MFRSNKHLNAIRKYALSFPESEEGSSCNKLSYKAGKKAYLYLGEDDDSYNLMVKLPDSYGEAAKLAKKSPDVYRPGSSGWVKCVFPVKHAPPAGLIERWIEESFRALVPKKIVAQLGESSGKTSAPKKVARKAAKKVAAKKTTGKNPARKRGSK